MWAPGLFSYMLIKGIKLIQKLASLLGVHVNCGVGTDCQLHDSLCLELFFVVYRGCSVQLQILGDLRSHKFWNLWFCLTHMCAKWLLVTPYPHLYSVWMVPAHLHTNRGKMWKRCIAIQRLPSLQSLFWTRVLRDTICYFCHVLADITSADREPAGSPNTAFPLGLRVRGLLLPLSCHTLLGMLSILQGTDVRAYLPSRPAVLPSSSTGRLRKPSQVPPLPVH